MVFLMNIGNTHTQTATYFDGKMSGVKTTKTSVLSSEILPKNMPIAATTVVPAVKKIFADSPIFWVDARVNTGLEMSKVDRTTIGGDRVANAIYLATAVPSPAVCIDIGTAITFEIIEGNSFCGGYILPGRHLLRRSLHDFTAQLPLLPLSQELPPELAGTNTERAMRLGIDGGVIGAVRELMNRVKTMFESKTVNFIGIGGDREFLINAIPEIKDGGNLCTLEGVRIAWERNNR
jgi:type III pantothenate kinase